MVCPSGGWPQSYSLSMVKEMHPTPPLKLSESWTGVRERKEGYVSLSSLAKRSSDRQQSSAGLKIRPGIWGQSSSSNKGQQFSLLSSACVGFWTTPGRTWLKLGFWDSWASPDKCLSFWSSVDWDLLICSFPYSSEIYVRNPAHIHNYLMLRSEGLIVHPASSTF